MDQPDQIDQPRVVICGSMALYQAMLGCQAQLRAASVPCIIPQAEDDVCAQLSSEQFLLFKRNVMRRYIDQIRDPRTEAVLAVNLERRGIKDYIGPSTFAELAIAFSESKSIYLLGQIPQVYSEELHAWRAHPLGGDLGRLIRAYGRAATADSLE